LRRRDLPPLRRPEFRLDDLCGRYTDDELRLILGFIRATTSAGQDSASNLAGSQD
jgi:hypothetical protein